jgi:hypothetical protein
LRLEAGSKYLLTVILDEWEKLKKDLNTESPFYRKTIREIVSVKESLCEGVPLTLSADSSRDILFNPAYDRSINMDERFDTYVGDSFNVLCHSYEFVRLLKDSKSSTGIRHAIERLERIFEEALNNIEREGGLAGAALIDFNTLTKVQLGSGLIVLNSLLESGCGT